MWPNLALYIYGINQPRVPAYNEIHERVGGEVYIALPAYNDIHGAIALYSAVLLVRVLSSMRAYMPSPPLLIFGGSMRTCTWYLWCSLVW